MESHEDGFGQKMLASGEMQEVPPTSQGGQYDVTAVASDTQWTMYANRFLPLGPDFTMMDDTDSVCLALVVERCLLSEKLVVSFLTTPGTDDDHLQSFEKNERYHHARVRPQPVDKLASRVSSDYKAFND